MRSTSCCSRWSSPSSFLRSALSWAFFGTGHFSGFGALTAEIYPRSIRATAQGFTYNAGRIASAFAPFLVGSLAATHGFSIAFGTTGAVFLVAPLVWIWIPETRGRQLE
jgi:MFS family permease